ncbi:MAG: hypothetical protein RI947_939 [Candidatus Parcubacteria bacterium]
MKELSPMSYIISNPAQSSGFLTAMLTGLQTLERILTWRTGMQPLVWNDKLFTRYCRLLREHSVPRTLRQSVWEQRFAEGLEYGYASVEVLLSECMAAGTEVVPETIEWMSYRIALRRLTGEEYSQLSLSAPVIYAAGSNDTAIIASARIYVVTHRPEAQIYLRDLSYKGSRAVGKPGDILTTHHSNLYVPAFECPQIRVA